MRSGKDRRRIRRDEDLARRASTWPVAGAVAGALVLGALLPGVSVSQQRPQGESGKGSSMTVPGPEQAKLSGGAAVYTKYCSQCHGDKGDGRGIASPLLRPAPRDFTSGKYQVRSTATGNLPTDDDIKHAIQRGLPSTAMPAFADALSDSQIDQLVQYVKSFSPRFQGAKAPEIIPIPKDPGYSTAHIADARKVYNSIGCAGCHGPEGRGNGPSAITLKDDWGQQIRPADLSRPWTFNSGATRQDIFKAISTGLNGTPMAGFASALSEQQRWALVDFITSLAGGSDKIDKPGFASLVIAQKVDGPLDLAKGAKLFDKAPSALFPLLGQVIQPGRDFAPAVIAIQAQAVYNADDVALLLTWHDIHADTTGNNGPDFELPEQEEHPGLSPAVSGGGQAPDPFAEEEQQGGGAKATAAAPAAKSADPFADDEAAPAAPAATPAASKPAAASSDESFWGEPGGGNHAANAAAAAPAPGGSEFSDAVAVQFPRKLPDGVRRPYFIFGDAQDPVELWFADLSHPDKAELWEGKGTKDLNPGEGVAPEVRAQYVDGEWQVLMKRKRDAGRGISFPDDTFVPMSFSVWDGFYRERGNKRALTTWYHLYVPPAEKPSPWMPMAKAAGAVLVLELLVIGWARRRRRREIAAAGAATTVDSASPAR